MPRFDPSRIILWPATKRSKLIWPLAGGGATLIVFVWMFRGIDTDEVVSVFRQSDPLWISLVVASIVGEQLVRGWKWRQLLFDLKPIGSLRLYGAVVAGYFANIVVPIGVSPFVRSWLIARLERLHFATVVMTTAIERFVDGVLFAALVMIVAAGATLPGTAGDLETGLILAGIGGFVVFGGVLVLLFAAKNGAMRMPAVMRRLGDWAAVRFGEGFTAVLSAFSQGIVWPKSRWRAGGVILASAVMKAISVSHFLWAGLAFGVALEVFDYMFLTVFAGASLIAARFIRIPGGFVIGSAYGLKLLGVPDEPALAMVLLVHFSSIATTVICGAVAAWALGVRIHDLRTVPKLHDQKV